MLGLCFAAPQFGLGLGLGVPSLIIGRPGYGGYVGSPGYGGYGGYGGR